MYIKNIIIIICCTLFFSSCEQKQKRDMAAIGKPAPDFSLVDLQGKTWTLSELKGKVVFLNFWATWCPPCVEEMPSMERLNAILPKDQFTMLTILNKDDPAIAKAFAEKYGITIPILDDRANVIGPKYGLTGVPETFIIDRKGIVREKFIGPAEWDSEGAVQLIKLQYIDQP